MYMYIWCDAIIGSDLLQTSCLTPLCWWWLLRLLLSFPTILSSQFRHCQLGIEPIHATNRTQVATPNPTFKEPRAHHCTKGDQQQQARGQVRGILHHMLQWKRNKEYDHPYPAAINVLSYGLRSGSRSSNLYNLQFSETLVWWFGFDFQSI